MGEEFDQLIGEIQPFEGAHELLAEVKERGFRLVLASSGKAQHVEAFLDLIDGKSLADAWATSDDVEKSKPEPDIVATALAKRNASPRSRSQSPLAAPDRPGTKSNRRARVFPSLSRVRSTIPVSSFGPRSLTLT